MSDGWNDSASGWIETLQKQGDFSRDFVLDGPMLARVRAGSYGRALDVGCGEGRFCRLLAAEGVHAVGIDPTKEFVNEAGRQDPHGEYLVARAEELPFEDDSFDLAVSYLTLIDITDAAAAIREMSRVLRPGGALLIANLNGFITAAMPGGWRVEADGHERYSFDNYCEERAEWVEWRHARIRILNWHRPFSFYMTNLLACGLLLTYFDEPMPTGGDPARAKRYRRVPYHHVMEWRKPR